MKVSRRSSFESAANVAKVIQYAAVKRRREIYDERAHLVTSRRLVCLTDVALAVGCVERLIENPSLASQSGSSTFLKSPRRDHPGKRLVARCARFRACLGGWGFTLKLLIVIDV